MAKNQFWYLDTDATTKRANAATNLGIKARGKLTHGDKTVETPVPVNRSSFFEGLADRPLPPMQLEFEIVLQDDNEMMLQNGATA